jgi:hypothetical protein
MVERSPIFGKDSTQIGYVQGGAAFDLSGRKRCNYSKETGNLFDDSRKTVGHVSLAGKFVGVFSIADKLFPKFDSEQMELRDVGRTPSQPVSEASQVAAYTDLAAASNAPDWPAAIQPNDEIGRRAADAKRPRIGETPSQPMSEAGQVVALGENTPIPLDSTEPIQAPGENEQQAAERGSSGTGSQLLSEPSQAIPVAELAEVPTTPKAIDNIQAKDESGQRVADAEHRDIRTLIQQLSEARPAAALIETAEKLPTLDPTEVIEGKDEKEQTVGDAEGHDVRTLIQQLSEARTVPALIESNEQPPPPDPTEVIQVKDGCVGRAFCTTGALLTPVTQS